MNRALISLCVAVAALVAGACREPAPPADPAHVTIVFKHAKLFGDPRAVDALLREFERENPGLAVRDETLPSASDEQHQFYAINLQARSADFDVFAVDVIWVAEFAHAGWLRDLSGLLPPRERTDFFPGPLEAVSYRDRIFAVPWFVDAGLLYYRQDLLDKHGFAPPATWGDLVRIAAAVTAREPGLHGFVWQGKQYEGLVCNALEYLWSNGGEVLRGKRVVLDSPRNREALRFMAELIHRDRVTPALVTTATEEPSRHIFGQGRALFLRNWPYAWAAFQRDGSAVQGKVGVTVLPHFPGGASAATLGGWQLAVNRYSRHPEAAEKLVRFLTSPGAQKQLALAYGFPPARAPLYDDSQLLAANPFLSRLKSVFERARPRPVTPYYVRLSQVLQGEFSAIISGMKTPETALASAQHEAERILADER